MQPSELDILEIISSVGQARSFYIEAIQEAKSKNYEGCNELVRKGNEMYAKGHRIHQLMIQEEAGGNHGGKFITDPCARPAYECREL